MRTVVVALLTILPVSLMAQQRPDTVPTDSVYELEPVVATGQRRVGTVGGASGLVAVVDSLSLRPMATVEDALRRLPFVLVRQNSRGMAEISVRGSDSRQVAVLLDGVPLSIAWDHRTDPSVIPLLGVQSLTLVRGLPSMLSGPNVLGGVVELNVGRAVGGPDLESGVRAIAGWDDAGYRALGVAGTRAIPTNGSRLVVRSGAGYRSRDGLPLPGGVEDPSSRNGLRTNSDVEEATGFGAVRWEGAAGSWLSLSGSAFRAERGVPPELHVEEPRLWRIPNEWQVVTAFSAGTGQRATPWGVGDLEASIGYNAGEQDIEAFSSMAYEEVVETESGEDGTLTLRLLGDHSVAANGEFRAAATYADIRHLEILDGTERNEYRQRLWSLGSEVLWRLPAATRLTLGAALDGADTPRTGGRPPLGALTARGGRVGLSTLAVGPNLQLHGSLSSRARFPALRELYSGALGRFEPNPDLQPERLNAAEVGTTWKGAAGEVQATVFRHRLTDAVVRITTPERRFRRVNRDEIKSTGVELLLGTTFGGAEILGDLLLQEVTVEDVLAKSGAVRPEHMPEFRAGLDVDAPLPLDLRGLVTVDHTGGQFCVHPDLGTDLELRASTRVDLGVRRTWRIGDGLWRALRGTVALDNAADASAFDQCGMPQIGRTLRIGLDLL